LGERAEMVAAVAAALEPVMPPRGFGEVADYFRGNSLAAGVLKQGLGALSAGLASCRLPMAAKDIVACRGRIAHCGHVFERTEKSPKIESSRASRGIAAPCETTLSTFEK
jgi:hypothetical protein